MVSEIFSSTSYNSVWTSPSDVWVLLNPDMNQWTEEIDWSLGMLLRRATLRLERKRNEERLRASDGSPSGTSRSDDVLLLAAPEGLPARRILVLRRSRGEDGEWLRDLGPILTKLKVETVTVFAPKEWRPPHVRQISDMSDGKWGLRWVEPAG